MYNKKCFYNHLTMVAIAVILLTVIAGCSSEAKGSDSKEIFSTSASVPQGINIKMDGMQSNHAPEEILPHVDLVVEATITKIDMSRWNTPDGNRPLNWTFEKLSEARIYTPYQFRIEKVLKGSIDVGTVSSFAVIGGTVGPDTIDASHSADIYGDLQMGDKALLFLKSTTGNMVHVSPFGYGDALRIEDDKVVAGCAGGRSQDACRVIFDMKNVMTKILPR